LENKETKREKVRVINLSISALSEIISFLNALEFHSRNSLG